jgi:hypothetical protein
VVAALHASRLVDSMLWVGLVKSYNCGGIRQGETRNLQIISNYFLLHRHELVWALVFAVVFGVIFAFVFALLFDLLPITSGIRSRIRLFRNKLAERSADKIRQRIKELEKYREGVAIYLVSDKAHYLNTLRFVLGILVAIALGASILITGLIFSQARREIIVPFYFTALACFLFGVVGGAYAIRIASLDTQAKISAMIENINLDIEKLKAKLPTR